MTTDEWTACINDWLMSMRSPHTRINYASDVDQFRAWAGVSLAEVNASHARTWSSVLRDTHAPASLNRKMAALASLFRFAADRGLWTGPNPFEAPGLRARVAVFGRTQFPGEADVRALLDAVLQQASEERAWRDFAIFFGLAATTRRISEWLHIKWGDIEEDRDGGHNFTFRAKGGRERRQVLPDLVWLALNRYMQAAGRVPAAADYVFSPEGSAGSKGMSTQHAGRLMRHYGEVAGIAPAKLHLHGLRHFAARWRKDHGATVFELQETLCHHLLTTTQIYTDAVLSTPTDRLAGAVGELLPASARRRLYNPRIIQPVSATFDQPNTAAAPLQQRGRNGNGTGNDRTA